MRKNCKRYWHLLKERKLIRLVFQHADYADAPEVRYNIELWKSAMSREKYRDFGFQKRYPSFQLKFEIETNNEAGKSTLICNLHDASSFLSTNPKIELE